MRRLSLLVILGCFLAPALVAGQEAPPQNLHRVGDHWTAWEPPDPASFPEGAEVYAIERGDTLWALAARFYGDPYLWPQLWERNRYILDAHWIYPGDPLLIGVEVVPIDDLAALEEVEIEAPWVEEPEPPRNPILSADEALGPPVPLGSESDIYCSGYIGDPDSSFPYQVVGSEYGVLLPDMFATERRDRDRDRNQRSIFGILDSAKYGLDTGDIVYLDGGRVAGLSPGQLYTVVEPREIVEHPLSEEPLGRLFGYQGRIQVLSVQEDTAIGEIVHTCMPIHVGSALVPFVEEPVPLGRETPLWPVNFPAPAEALAESPAIVYARGDVVSMGEDSLVYIDRGADHDVLPGDVFTIYRLNRPGLPPVVLGELAVLSAHERTSVARILKSRHTIFLGDRLLLK